MSLRKIKENRETDESPKADIWCHFALIAWHTILGNALQSLRRIKTVKESKVNMWRNFGKVVIRGPDEGKLIDSDFSLL